MKFRIFFIAAICIFLLQHTYSQLPDDTLFNTAVLHDIHIEFENDHFWDSLMAKVNYGMKRPVKQPANSRVNSNESHKNMIMAASVTDDDNIDYVAASITIDGMLINPVGVRFKGLTSFSYSDFKKPFRIDLNEFNDTSNFYGIKKFSLNNGVGDPSLQREAVCYSLMRKAGIAAPRTSYAKLYLNGIYWGIYLIVEQVDKTFLEKNFASGEGNLFKTVGWATLTYESENFADYNQSIQLRTNEDVADGKDFVRLVKNISNYDGRQFIDSIQRIFYVDYFFKVLAIDIITKNWDSFMQHGRNFYLYHEPVSDLFYWIPWDYNFALESQFMSFGTDTNGCNLDFEMTYDTVGTTAYYKCSLKQDSLQYFYFDYGDASASYTHENSIPGNTGSKIVFEFNHQYARRGIYSPYCFLSTFNGCSISKNFHLPLMDTSGLCPTALQMQMPYFPNDTFPLVYEKEPFCCDCQWDNICQSLYYNINSVSPIDDSSYPISYTSDKQLIYKLLNDTESRNRYFDIFKFILDSVYDAEELTHMINANADLIRNAVYADTNYIFNTGDFENDITVICDQSYGTTSLSRILEKRKPGLTEEFKTLNHIVSPIDKPVNFRDVVINEIASDLNDDYGQNISDWIELYNNTNKIVSLKNMSISDSYMEPEKFSFLNNSAIKPDGYLILWADDKDTKDGYHTGFKLSSSGEEVILFHKEYGSIDTVQFGDQMQNYTYSRFPNGTGSFVIMEPTFNSRNQLTSGFGNPTSSNTDIGFIVYPNPVDDILTCVSPNTINKFVLTLYNSLGQQLIRSESVEGKVKIDFTGYTMGIYIIEIRTDYKQFNTKVIKY